MTELTAALALVSSARQAAGMVGPFAKFVNQLTPKRRWAQFSLGTLLALVGALCVLLAWLAPKIEHKRRERAAVAHFLELGAWVCYDWQWAANPQPPGPAWLRARLGDDVFAQVDCIGGFIPTGFRAGALRPIDVMLALDNMSFPPRITDSDLSQLAAFPNLKRLGLGDSQVTDAGLAHLATFSQLEELDLHGTRVTDAGLPHLAALRNLEKLDLNYTLVTDAGLRHLRRLTKLRELKLSSIRITFLGAFELQKALPDCQIDR